MSLDLLIFAVGFAIAITTGCAAAFIVVDRFYETLPEKKRALAEGREPAGML